MSHEKGSGTDVGKTAAGVALGILSVPVIITIVVIVLVLGLCVLCFVLGGIGSIMQGAGG
jgi:uncharacterized membrane protein